MNILDFRIIISLCLLFTIGVSLIVFFVREKPIKKLMDLSFIYLLLTTFIIYILVIKNFETILFPIFIIIFINFLLTLITGISIVNNLLIKNKPIKEEEYEDDFDEYFDKELEENTLNDIQIEDTDDEIEEINDNDLEDDNYEEDSDDEDDIDSDEDEGNFDEQGENDFDEDNYDKNDVKDFDDDFDKILKDNDNTETIKQKSKNYMENTNDIGFDDKYKKNIMADNIHIDDNMLDNIFDIKKNDFDFDKAIQDLNIHNERNEEFDNDIDEDLKKIKERIDSMKMENKNNQEEDDNDGTN